MFKWMLWLWKFPSRFEITHWEYTQRNEEFIWWEWLNPGCGCYLLTICNVLIVYYNENDCDE